MKHFIVYDGHGKILRTGTCQNKTFYLQARIGEFVIAGKADATTQKIANAGVKDKVVDKTPEEIEEAKPPEPEPISVGQQPANITNEQWQNILDRLRALEGG